MNHSKLIGFLILIIVNVKISLIIFLLGGQVLESYIFCSSIMILIFQSILKNAFYTYWKIMPRITLYGALILPMFIALNVGDLQVGIATYFIIAFFLFGGNAISSEKIYKEIERKKAREEVKNRIKSRMLKKTEKRGHKKISKK